MINKDIRVCVAMSGGVDSSVAAKLLCDKGLSVGGAIMKLFDNANDISDAKAVAEYLGIAFDEIDCRESFKSRVIDSFVSSYVNGETPNPCVVCNEYVKFGTFLDGAVSLGYDKVATGHYVSLEIDTNGRTLLKKGADESKDQSYVLYGLSQYQLSHSCFPLGSMSKAQIRELANEYSLPCAHRPESQDICFIKNGDYASYIENVLGRKLPEGDMLLTSGELMAKHKGIIHYTIGQRKGLGVSYKEPLFVVKKSAQTNSVILGTSKELFGDFLVARDVNFIPFDRLTGGMNVTARTRYHQRESKAAISMIDEDKVLVEFEAPQRAICAGQSVVFYDGEYVIGGGIITE